MFELSQFIDSCRRALNEPNPPVAIQNILSSSMANAEDLESVLAINRSRENRKNGYFFLHQAPNLTILHVVLPGRTENPPHNHLAWAVIGMYKGRENNIFYRQQSDSLIEIGRRELIGPDVMKLDQDVIHSIANPASEWSYALHVYGGVLNNPSRSLWNPFTFKEESFQLSSFLTYEKEMMLRNGHDKHNEKK